MAYCLRFSSPDHQHFHYSRSELPPKVGHKLSKMQFFTAKPKYSLEIRLAVVNHYQSGKDGAKRTAAFFGVERTSVRRWVRAWQLHGIDGITWKNDCHSPEFRQAVVLTALSEELSMREAAARFNISNETVVRHWVNVYKDAGQKGLLSIKPRRSKAMTKPKKTSPLTDTVLEKLSPEGLRAEKGDKYIHYYDNERISLKLKRLSPVDYRTQVLKAA
ncbi:TPA: helix-turn-helix domain-containing protein [Yersinia enterocolitica]|nr:helix-turn-helix domain-containing protein [Yersinia enterocolitica]